jgi:hypothetical protein
MLVWTSSLLGKLEVYAILENDATNQTELAYLILSPMYVKTHYSIFCRCPDPVSEGAKHPNLVSEGAKHVHFSKFSCEKTI